MTRRLRIDGPTASEPHFWDRIFPGTDRRRDKRRRRSTPMVLQLESRQLLSGDVVSGISAGMEFFYQDPVTGKVFELDAAPAPTGLAGAAGASGARHPLSSVPVLNSLPGARASIYLDFIGDYEASWGSYGAISTPAFDADGDPTSFSDSELTAIRNIWSDVAEDYSPFNINVTTAAPPSFANGVAQKMVIGGSGSWMGATYGGISYVGSFSNDMPNVSFVFSNNLGNGDARYTADAVSHEAGHAFGLNHQSTYSGSTLTQEYSTGPGNGVAPLMGNSYSAGRSLWWHGTSDVSSSSYQDDMSVIAGAANGFGYRPESAGTTAATATPIGGEGGRVYASGVIRNGQDVNFYSVVAGAGSASFTVNAAAGSNNLVPTLQLLDSTGTVMLASASTPSDGSSATITYTFAEAGSYRLVVWGNDAYGNAGQYSLSGTVEPPPTWLAASAPAASVSTVSTTTPAAPVPVVTGPPAAPSGLSVASRSGNSVTIVWNDVADNETGYQIQRSTNGGKTWSTIATVSADSSAFADGSVRGRKRYVYRVIGFNAQGTSASSNLAAATTPKSTATHYARHFKTAGRFARPFKAMGRFARHAIHPRALRTAGH